MTAALELRTCEHFLVRYDERRKIVLLTRTPAPFASLDDIEPCLKGVRASLVTVQRRQSGILVDTREGPVRNDPEFERIFEPNRRQILAGFARAAVLVRTAAGRLQARRYTRDDRQDTVRIFEDEQTALAYLESGEI